MYLFSGVTKCRGCAVAPPSPRTPQNVPKWGGEGGGGVKKGQKGPSGTGPHEMKKRPK